MPDTGALGISLAGEQQYIALKRDYPDLQLREEEAQGSIVFRKGAAKFRAIV
jgi:hypothetical protein